MITIRQVGGRERAAGGTSPDLPDDGRKALVRVDSERRRDGGESVEEALVRVLEARQDLLRALWRLGLGQVSRVTH